MLFHDRPASTKKGKENDVKEGENKCRDEN
jgi:hypothetical protein